MVRLRECIALLVIAHITSALINNTQIEERNDLQDKKTRRKHQSTSSSDVAESNESEAESIDITDVTSSDSEQKKKDQPKSSAERTGWRKWHRKCTPCNDDMRKKWRDPTIKWICGAYQRARRSFKSLCMMHYRNCQDGTMFVKIHDHRCANSSDIEPHGDHFFYEYRVVLSDDDSDSKTVSETSIEESRSYSY